MEPGSLPMAEPSGRGFVDLKIPRTTVQSQVVEKLREAIFSGVFLPGEKLSEPALCRDLAVSRTSIREALRSLAAERLVTIVPNRGPSVTEISWEEADAIYQVRALLEGEAMALLARRVQPAQLRLMEGALGDFAEAMRTDDPLGRVTSTARFYQVILDCCGNPVVAELAQGLLARISFLRARSMSSSGRSQGSLREMQAMLDALKAGDPEAARVAAVAHIQAARAAAQQVFAGRATPPD
jgi:DNA-binding GntR family transcriptional regulator